MDDDFDNKQNDVVSSVQDFLKEVKDLPPTPETVTNEGLIKVLHAIGDINISQALQEPESGVYKFAEEVVKNDAEVKAVASILNRGDEVIKNNAYKGVMSRKREELRDLNLEVCDEYGDRNQGITSEDFKFDGEVYEDGLRWLHYDPNIQEKNNFGEGLENSEAGKQIRDVYMHQKTEFMNKFVRLPQEIQDAVIDYKDWLWGQGKYRGQTGRKLDEAKAAGFVKLKEYDSIINARNGGFLILSNEDELRGTKTYPKWNKAFNTHDYASVRKQVWAVSSFRVKDLPA